MLFRSPVVALLEDRWNHVRYQAVLTAGLGVGDAAIGPLVQLLRGIGGDVRFRHAILASIAPADIGTVLQTLVRDSTFAMAQTASPLEIFREVTDLIGARAESRAADFETAFRRLEMGLSEQVRSAILEGLAAGLERSGKIGRAHV